MTNKIKELTSEQKAALPEYLERYMKIGISTSPINFDVAVDTMKTFLGSDADGYTFKFIESPKQLPPDSREITYGAHDVHWVSYYTFLNDFFGICPEIKEMDPVVRNCSWVFYSTSSREIYIVDSPRLIKFDDQNRLHNENGPAIAYEDGFEVYSWHGSRIPKEWIMDKNSLGPTEFLNHPNVEMRRVACEIVGWANVLKRLKPTVIDEDGDPEIGTLLEVEIPEIGKEKFLRVMCGTKREFAIPVPPEAKTALEAQAMLFGLTVEEFIVPEIRT